MRQNHMQYANRNNHEESTTTRGNKKFEVEKYSRFLPGRFPSPGGAGLRPPGIPPSEHVPGSNYTEKDKQTKKELPAISAGTTDHTPYLSIVFFYELNMLSSISRLSFVVPHLSYRYM